jgi:TonB-dependent starch-binding outer membrane protein SusC
MVMVRGLQQDYDLSVGGGTKDVNYYWSLGYVNNEGIIKGDMFSAIRSRLNVDFKITDWLRVGANTQFSDRDESATPANLSRVYRISPWSSPTYNAPATPQANYGFRLSKTTEHPLMEYYYTDRSRKVANLFSSLFAEVDLPLGIKYKLSFQPRYSFLRDYNFYGDHNTVGYGDHIDGYGTRQESSSFEWMLDNLLKWNKEVGIHNFDITLLYSSERLRTQDTNINNQTFSPNLELGYHALQFGKTPAITNYDTEATGDALMARLNYTLLGKYLLTTSIRRDGYSAFGQENPRAFFPSVALAWQISKEDFYRIELISRMKLRLSWGANGNRDIGMYSALANVGSNLYYNGSGTQVGVYNNTLANSGLKWERTESLNFGLDLGFFGNRIDLTLDYYDMKTTNLLMKRTLPEITGFSSIMSNLGELGNRGFEATLNMININKSSLTWKSSLVLSLNRNKIIKLFGDVGTYTLLGEERTGELPDFSNQWFPGQAIDVIWNYNTIGIWQEEEAEAAAVFGSRIGDYKAVDVNEDGKYVNVQDKQFIGYTRPRYRIGVNNDFSFLKNFTLSIFVRADLGHLGQFTPIFQGSSEFDRFSMGAKPYPYWMPENRNNEYPRLDANVGTGVFGGGISIYKPMSFVRIQDLSLSYSLSKELTQRLHLESMRTFLSVRNLYSFDKWPGWDPESGMNAMPRTFTFGIDISL